MKYYPQWSKSNRRRKMRWIFYGFTYSIDSGMDKSRYSTDRRVDQYRIRHPLKICREFLQRIVCILGDNRYIPNTLGNKHLSYSFTLTHMSDYKTQLKNLDALDKNLTIAFVVGEFNLHHTAPLEKVNREFFESHGFKNIDTYWVPGAFEIPGFTAKLLDADAYDLIITLGVVVRGDTPHFDYVCGETARGIMNLTTSYEIPIIF